MNRDIDLVNADIEAKIKEFGYAVLGIFDTENKGNPTFLYTVGLSNKLDFEIMICGNINMQIMHTIINQMAYDLQESGINPLDKGIFGGASLLDGSDLRCKYIDVTDHPNMKTDFVVRRCNDKDIKVYQMLFADGSNILPDEEGYDQKFKQTLDTFNFN